MPHSNFLPRALPRRPQWWDGWTSSCMVTSGRLQGRIWDILGLPDIFLRLWLIWLAFATHWSLALAYFAHLPCQLCSSLVQVLLQMTGGGWRAHCHISRRGGEVESFRIEAPKRGCQNPGARLRPGDQVPRCKGSEYLTTLQNLIEFDSCMTCACWYLWPEFCMFFLTFLPSNQGKLRCVKMKHKSFYTFSISLFLKAQDPDRWLPCMATATTLVTSDTGGVARHSRPNRMSLL